MEWREKINLNSVLAKMDSEHDLSRLEEDCPAEVKEAIAVEVAKSSTLGYFAGRIRRAKSIAAVNRVLARLFDEADKFKVWCGSFVEA